MVNQYGSLEFLQFFVEESLVNIVNHMTCGVARTSSYPAFRALDFSHPNSGRFPAAKLHGGLNMAFHWQWSSWSCFCLFLVYVNGDLIIFDLIFMCLEVVVWNDFSKQVVPLLLDCFILMHVGLLQPRGWLIACNPRFSCLKSKQWIPHIGCSFPVFPCGDIKKSNSTICSSIILYCSLSRLASDDYSVGLLVSHKRLDQLINRPQWYQIWLVSIYIYS